MTGSNPDNFVRLFSNLSTIDFVFKGGDKIQYFIKPLCLFCINPTIKELEE